MENKDKPAFPRCMVDSNTGANVNESGMTKREYFACMAMQGTLSNPQALDALTNQITNPKEAWIWLAKNSIDIADELLKQLEQ